MNAYKNKTHLRLCNPDLYRQLHQENKLDELFPDKEIVINRSQLALYEIVKIIFPKNIVTYDNRKIIYPKELDIFLPELNIAFEYDGLHFHSSDEAKIRDAVKDDICKNKNITLYRIIENKEKKGLNFTIDNIIKQLSIFGFGGLDLIENESIIDNIKTHFINKSDILNLAKTCKSYKEFTKTYSSLHHKAVTLGLISQIKNIIEENHKTYTEDEIVKIISGHTRKKDFRNDDPIVYKQMMMYKYNEAIAKYNELEKIEFSKVALENISKGAKRKRKPEMSLESKTRYAAYRKSTPGPTAGRIMPESEKEKHKQPMAESTKEKLRVPQEIVTCPHCNIAGGKNSMTRYHFDRCKFKPE